MIVGLDFRLTGRLGELSDELLDCEFRCLCRRVLVLFVGLCYRVVTGARLTPYAVLVDLDGNLGLARRLDCFELHQDFSFGVDELGDGLLGLCLNLLLAFRFYLGQEGSLKQLALAEVKI